MRIKYIPFILLFISSIISAQIIPKERKIEWKPGIPSGIPELNYPITNVLKFGADSSGRLDSYFAFKSAIQNIPESGGVILIPEGKYRIDTTIVINRDNVLLKGEGADKTKLLMYNDGTSIKVEIFGESPWWSLKTNYIKGDTKIFVNNHDDFKVGLFAEIRQENDPNIMYTKPEWEQPWSYYSVGQVFEIKNMEDGFVEFSAPLNFDLNSQLNPQIKVLSMVTNVGFEDFYVEKKNPNSHTFSFQNAAYCWIKNIESYKTRRSHVFLSSSLGNEIRESFFHASFDYGGGGSGYGVECNRHSTNNLIENNNFDSLRHAMLVQVGANGNVYGYNYSINPVQSEGDSCLNQDWTPPDISIHGHYPFMNLFEGNYVQEIGISDWWGPVGPGNTYFRNFVNGDGIFYKDYSNTQNIIGNQITVIISDSTSKGILEYKNIIDSKLSISNSNMEGDLIPSLYHKEKPKFLEEIFWPVFGPNSNGNEILPAQKRHN